MNGFLPVYMRMDDRHCLVIGGGPVALRRVQSLLDARANVTVLSPALHAGLKDLSRAGRIAVLDRRYVQGDLKGFSIVVETTGDPLVSRQVAFEAAGLGILLNTADVPERCDFYFPAIVRRKNLILAAGTSGSAPGLAARIRRQWEEEFDQRYARLLDAYERFRAQVQQRFAGDQAKRKRILDAALDRALMEASNETDVDRLFERMMEWIS